MYIDDYGNEYECEEDYLRTLKKEDSYHFSIPFEYIKKNYGNGKYDIDTAIMEVSVQWDDACCGYKMAHNCPDMYKIDPSEGNGDEDEFFEYEVRFAVEDLLDRMGIGCTAII